MKRSKKKSFNDKVYCLSVVLLCPALNDQCLFTEYIMQDIWYVMCDMWSVISMWQDMWYVFLYQVHKLHKCVSSKGLIQLWNVGQLKSDSARWSFVMFPFSRLYLYCRKQNVPTSLNSTDLASFWIFASNEGFLQPNNMLCQIYCDSWISL